MIPCIPCQCAVVLFSSLVFMYVDANFTSMMLRFYQEVESYRTRIGAVDGCK